MPIRNAAAGKDERRSKPALILIVDDLPENCALLEVLLVAHGYETVSAHDGEEALAQARAAPPDLVISDLLMPVMDGFTLLRHWKADPRLGAVPFVVYTSSYVEAEDEQAVLDMGADGFLVKPAESEVLLSALERVLAQAQVARPKVPIAELEDVAAGLRAYSEILIRKLERRSLQLDATNRALQRDIAQRMQAEERLRLLDCAVTQSKEAIVITDAELDLPGPTIVFVNTAFTELTGYQPSEALGRTPRMLHGPLTDGEVLKRLRQDLDRGVAFEGEAINYRKDGSQYDQEWQVAPIRDDGGAVTHYLAIMRDVTERNRTRQQLRDSRMRLDGIVSSTMDAIVSVDSDQNILLFNPAAEAMFGYSAADVVGGPLDLMMPTRFRADHADHIVEFGRYGETSEGRGILHSVTGLRKNGEEFAIESSISKDESTGKSFFTAIMRDITERTRSEARISRLDRVRSVMSGIDSLIVRVRKEEDLFNAACSIAVDEGGFDAAWIGLADAARTGLALTGWAGSALHYRDQVIAYLRDPLPSHIPLSILMREGKELILNDIANDPRARLQQAALENGYRSLVILPLKIDGEVAGIFTLYSNQAGAFDGEEMTVLLRLADDISFALDHIRKTQRLEYLAYHDSLTGLANRSLFLQRIAQHMRGPGHDWQSLGVVLADIERFKDVNDTLGRPAGDALLKHVAAWLSERVGTAHRIARVGADQFALIMPGMQVAEVARFLDNPANALVDTPFRVGDAEMRITVKFGVSMFPADGSDAETLYKHAELALRKAKSSGERYVIYTQRLSDAVAGRLVLENQLRQALANEQFVLFYQPKFNVTPMRVTGAEALIRWNDPRTGLVPPGKFIPVLEETGLIHDVGRWAMKQAMRDNARWHSANKHSVPIAVNVSALQLRSAGFVAEVARLLEETGCLASSLELEITEGMLMHDVGNSIATLSALRDMGIRIAIDDFGTGYSSLGYLAKLPIDTLKVDRTFVVDMTKSPEGLALVSTIITLAHSLKLKVVAEGVETEEEARLLRLLDCDEIQGYLFGKPMASGLFETEFLG